MAIQEWALILQQRVAAPLAGRVCMDQIMVDPGPNGTAFNGDEVVLIGSQNGEHISAGELATLAGTIPYEVLTHLNERLPRVYCASAED